jgi:hypothetical protein
LHRQKGQTAGGSQTRRRSKLFVMDRVGKIKSLDAVRIADAIEFTRFPSPNGGDDSDDELAR